MRRLALVCAIVSMGCLGCSKASDGANRGPNEERQWEIVDRLNAAYEQQLAKGADGLRKAEEQARRFDAILDKWEEQVRRYDAILDRWEQMFPLNIEGK